ncbi:MAG: T9SS type A sorting domain-containing protein [Candidatus Zixiibacteriota bacterium]|nr:MAG: T9SS type A sorting domain-containing protein [candidate division Zixibacteria bacterium]
MENRISRSSRRRPVVYPAVASVLTALAISAGTVEAQQLAWETNYGGQYNESGYACQRTSDSGYVVLGSTYSFGAGDHDVYLLRLTAYGDTLFSRTYGGPETDYGYDVLPTSDGGFVITGMTRSAGSGKGDVYLLKVDSVGTVIFEKTYGGPERDEGRSVRRAPDGGLIIAGTTASFGAGYDDVYLLKVDQAGNLQWSRTYGGTGGESGSAVRVTPDGGYAVIGSTGSFGEGYSSIYLIRTDSNGDSVWARTYGGTRADFGYSLEPTLDSGFALIGWTTSYGAGYSDVFLLKIDSAGYQEWQNTFGGDLDERGYSVQQAADGSFVIGGTTETYGNGKVDLYMISLDTLGHESWSITMGGIESDYCRSIVMEDQACIAIGCSYSYSSGGSDVYISKVRTDQMTPVEEPLQALPDGFLLAQNYPNPFNLSTTIEFQLPQRGRTRLCIYNLLGRLVRQWQYSSAPAGLNSISWDGTDESGRVVSSGVYFYRLETARFNRTKKMVLLK